MKIELIPEIKDVDLAFSTQKTNKKLLSLAKESGFYNGNTKYNDMFSSLFFRGGKINCNKKLDEESKVKLLRYFKALASSFDPKHEEKEAVCALILSWLCD